MKADNTLGKLGVGMAIGGIVLGLVVLFTTGISNATGIVRDETNHELLIALPLPSVGLLLSVVSILSAHRQQKLKAFALVSLSGLVISAGGILLALTAWNSYK